MRRGREPGSELRMVMGGGGVTVAAQTREEDVCQHGVETEGTRRP